MTEPVRNGWAARCMLASIVLCALLAGCAAVGSTAIRNGRAVYNEAIVATNNEQLLAMIVRLRYDEPYGLLAVASVTANIRIQATVGAQFGFGPDTDYSGNLVPLSAGALYEENPTISYTPAQGQEYLRQLLSPLPLDFTVLLLGAVGDAPESLALLLRGINRVQNGAFRAVGEPGGDGRFAEIAELLATLHRRGWLVWTPVQGNGDANDEPGFAMVLQGQGDEYARQLGRLGDLLGVDVSLRADQVNALRVVLGIESETGNVVALRSRSVYELFEIAASAIDVPPEHLESGLAPPPSCSLEPVAPMRIRRSADRPKQALVAVRHHGWWYSIDGTDTRSKQTFRLLEAIVTARMADSVVGQAATPVLTVPVSR